MGAAARVKVAAAEEVAAAPIVLAVVADLLAAVRDATEGATSRRNAPRKRAIYSPSVLGARVLATSWI